MNIFPRIIYALKDPVIINSIKVLFFRASGAGLQIIVLFLITNFTEETLVGQYNYFSYTIILLSAFVLLGMNTSFLQFSGKLQAEGNFEGLLNLYSRGIRILIISFTGLWILYWVVSELFVVVYFKDPQVSFVLNKVFWTLLPFSITMLNLEVLRALDYLFFSEFLRNIGRFGLLLIFIVVLIFYNIVSYIFDAFLVSFIILAIISTFFIWRRMRSFVLPNKINKISYKDIIKVSFPMSFSFISLLIMQSFDIYVLESYHSFTSVAYYGVAIKISAVVAIILSSINATIAPDISKNFFEKDFEKLSKVIKKATRLNLLLSIPLILFILFFSSFILELFGTNYVLAQQALYIILIGQIVNALCGPVGLYLNMTGRQNYFQKILLVALIINIIMNLVFIPEYEMIGAAISTAFSFTFWNLSGLIYVLIKDKINLSIFGIV